MEKTIVAEGRELKLKVDLSADDLLIPIEKVNRDETFMKRSRMLKYYIVIMTLVIGVCLGITLGLSFVTLYLDESIRFSIVPPILITDELVVLFILALALLFRFKIFKTEVEFDARREKAIFGKKDLTEASFKEYAALYKDAYKLADSDELKRELALLALGFEDKSQYHLIEKYADNKVYLQIWNGTKVSTVGEIAGVKSIVELKGNSLLFNKNGLSVIQED